MNDCAANKAVLRRLFDEWINNKNLAAIDEMVTPTYVSHEGGEEANAEYTKKFLAGVFTSFPDIHVTIEEIGAKAIRWWFVIHGVERTRADSGEWPPPERTS